MNLYSIDLKIEQDIQNDLLLLSCSGINSHDTHLSIIKRIREVLSQNPTIKKIFADVTGLEGELSILEKFKVGESVSQNLLGVHIAALTIEGRINGIGENAAINRGASIFVTTNKEDAFAWLNNIA